MIIMSEKEIKASFKRVKEDMEGLKNEVAFALKRIAQLENMLIKKSITAPARKGKRKK